MWQILRAYFSKFIKLSNNRISLNWSMIDDVTTGNTTAYFFGPLCMSILTHKSWLHVRYEFDTTTTSSTRRLR